MAADAQTLAQQEARWREETWPKHTAGQCVPTLRIRLILLAVLLLRQLHQSPLYRLHSTWTPTAEASAWTHLQRHESGLLSRSRRSQWTTVAITSRDLASLGCTHPIKRLVRVVLAPVSFRLE